jgi:hypothetical protein
MSKEEAWRPDDRTIFDYVKHQKICRICFEVGHLAHECESEGEFIEIESLLEEPRFRVFLQRWMLGRRNRGKTWRLDFEELGIAFCDSCLQIGHWEMECPAGMKCLHCGGNHDSHGCKVNPFAVLGDDEQMDVRE